MSTDWLSLPPEDLTDLAEHWEVVPEPASTRTPVWRSRAACKNRAADMLAIETAAPVCEACPVKAQCLAFALDTEPDDTFVFAGTTFADRTRICPICEGPKEPTDLGCSPSHVLLRIARLIQIEAEGDPDVKVTMRSQPSYRTYQHCPLPRGANHAAGNSYREGCRCPESIAARNEEKRRLTGVNNPRGPYKRKAS